MIKNRSTFVSNVLSKVLLFVMLLWVSGCKCPFWAQSGETAAEGDRRHTRNLKVNQESLSGDIDRALLFDKPSKATDIRIPAPTENK